ncbi:MAG TPA: DUF1810 domain-containing protein [Candidatus Dormibacteraeota bacterium]|nr:DUF1810 domain-containing protein [Candidatus Dormibacteraeota bacterium]
MSQMEHDLERFVTAQADTYESALRQLREGSKTGHWMWFVFPQVEGLGRSDVSRYFGIRSLGEARAYLAHPLLGPRLRECAAALLAVEGLGAEAILGGIDALKLRSSMTLFHRAAPDEPLFEKVLQRYYAGRPDPMTDEILGQAGTPDEHRGLV